MTFRADDSGTNDPVYDPSPLVEAVLGHLEENNVPHHCCDAVCKLIEAKEMVWSELLVAAELILAELNARIDVAPAEAKPVFNGISELHTAITNVKEKP